MSIEKHGVIGVPEGIERACTFEEAERARRQDRLQRKEVTFDPLPFDMPAPSFDVDRCTKSFTSVDGARDFMLAKDYGGVVRVSSGLLIAWEHATRPRRSGRCAES